MSISQNGNNMLWCKLRTAHLILIVFCLLFVIYRHQSIGSLSLLWQVFMYWWIYGTIVLLPLCIPCRENGQLSLWLLLHSNSLLPVYWCDNLILPDFGLQSTLIYNNWLIGWSFDQNNLYGIAKQYIDLSRSIDMGIRIKCVQNSIVRAMCCMLLCNHDIDAKNLPRLNMNANINNRPTMNQRMNWIRKQRQENWMHETQLPAIRWNKSTE